MGSVLLKVVGILCRTLLDTYVAQIHEQGIALVHSGVARNFCLTLPHDIPDSSTCVLSEGAGLDTIEREHPACYISNCPEWQFGPVIPIAIPVTRLGAT